MKRQEVKQLHNKTQGELKVLLTDLGSTLFKARMEFTQNKLKNLRKLRELRWDIARILTVINLKEKEEKKKNA